MDKVERVKVIKELFELVNYYYENRDQPVNNDFDFSGKVEKYCELLDLEPNVFFEEFNLNK